MNATQSRRLLVAAFWLAITGLTLTAAYATAAATSDDGATSSSRRAPIVHLLVLGGRMRN